MEFGVADAVTRFTTILKQKIRKSNASSKADPKLSTEISDGKVAIGMNGLASDGKSRVDGGEHGSSDSRNISMIDVVSAEKLLDQVILMHFVVA